MIDRNVTPKDPKIFLFTLINSMTKAEKRSFKLYVNRTQQSGSLKIVKLFDVLDKLSEQNDELILQKMQGVTTSQLANLKRHLYQQILISLRLGSIQKNVDIQLREQIDFARILYGKGLYWQSLRILERIKNIAKDNHQDLLHLEILEFLKRIEERHITRSRQTPGKMEGLEDSAAELSKIIHNSCKLSNLKIALHGYYIRYGHAKTVLDSQKVEREFNRKLSEIQQDQLTFFEKVYLYQSYVWYHHIMLDFKSCLNYAEKWIRVFDETPKLIDEDPDLYLRGYHYALTALYNDGDKIFFEKYLKRFEKFILSKYDTFNYNTRVIVFLYLYGARLNKHFLNGSFEEGELLVPEIINNLDHYAHILDVNRILVFNFKIAYLYFALGNYDKCQDYLLNILKLKVGTVREGLQSHARILELLVHYELGHFKLLKSLVKTCQNFLEKVKELTKVQKATLKLFKVLVQEPKEEHRQLFQSFIAELELLKIDYYEQRAFLYLDVYSWALGHIKGVPLANIIKQKYK